MESSKRLKYLDIAKGIAIILVVLGHCFPENIFGGEDYIDKIGRIIYDFIYSFHMPIFFYIAGFLFYNSWKSHNNVTMKKKAKRLLIPYITFSTIYIPLRLLLSSLANSNYDNNFWKILIGISPNGRSLVFIYFIFIFLIHILFN